jgi:hypothetical protein
VLLQIFQLSNIPPDVMTALWSALPGIIVAATALVIAFIKAAQDRLEKKLDETREIHCANRQILQDTHDDLAAQRRELQNREPCPPCPEVEADKRP